MGLLNWAVKLATSSGSKRLTGSIIHSALSNNLIAEAPADRVLMNSLTADIWRRHMAEQLGREVADTPLPAEINGTRILIDEALKIGQVQFETDTVENGQPGTVRLLLDPIQD